MLTLVYFTKEGFEVTVLPVDEYGLVSVKDLETALREQTILVTIMMANNEVGTVMPTAEIGRLCQERGIVFHTDAVQAIGKLPVDVNELHVDLLSLSAHKFYGPKGIGALYVRKGTRLSSYHFGGAQERKIRPGTENVPGIVGLGKQLNWRQVRWKKNKRIKALRDKLKTVF